MRRHKLLSATIAAIIAIPSIVYAAEPEPADGDERPLADWPDAGEDAPSYQREEDAGQTVPR